ncbi:hypothetical protein H5410_032015 [Solanum commersonii]|uniref:Uncharacterized protein n=1 Tax=Solanum commersonii TaxID=4109 RepID=A0A9J5YKX3_SOLCO|nr:hypothetical protein H5410_032015 [Solanum commersonii]
MSCIKSHKLQLFTRPRGSDIPTWVWKFYVAYGALIPQRKKQVATFKLVDDVVVRGKKVLCDSTIINEVLECTNNIADAHPYKMKTKSLEGIKAGSSFSYVMALQGGDGHEVQVAPDLPSLPGVDHRDMQTSSSP